VIIQAHQYSDHVAGAGCDVISFMSENISNGFVTRFGHAGACEAVVRFFNYIYLSIYFIFL
jgi:hypothetical protein